MNTSLWYGGSSPHQPFHCSSLQSPPPTGPNMLRPITPAPTFSSVSCMMRVLSFTSPPCLSCDSRQAASENGPVMQPLPTLAERVLLALVRAGDESVCRDRDVTPELAHRASSGAGRVDRGDIDVMEKLWTRTSDMAAAPSVIVGLDAKRVPAGAVRRAEALIGGQHVRGGQVPRSWSATSCAVSAQPACRSTA